MTRVNTLTEIWNTYNNNILSEKAPGVAAAKFGTKPGKGAKNLNDKDAGAFANHDTSGPENADRGETAHPYSNVIDPKHNEKKDELYNSEIYSSEKYDKKIEKKVKESINNYMKSTFDKLFENVMGEEMHSDQETQELDALGIDTEVAETDDEGKVTLTLDRDMVKQLCDVLKEALGEDEDADEDMEHEDYEMEEVSDEAEEHEDGEDHDEDEDTHKEAVEAEDLGHTLVNAKDTGLTNPGHNKVGTVKPKGGKASDSTKKYVEAEPKPLADGKGHLTGKNNKAGSGTVASVGADLFG